VVTAQREHSFPCRAIAHSGEQSIARENSGNRIVGANSHQHPDCFDDLFRCVRIGRDELTAALDLQKIHARAGTRFGGIDFGCGWAYAFRH
jgi:hypothetical protein